MGGVPREDAPVDPAPRWAPHPASSVSRPGRPDARRSYGSLGDVAEVSRKQARRRPVPSGHDHHAAPHGGREPAQSAAGRDVLPRDSARPPDEGAGGVGPIQHPDRGRLVKRGKARHARRLERPGRGRHGPVGAQDDRSRRRTDRDVGPTYSPGSFGTGRPNRRDRAPPVGHVEPAAVGGHPDRGSC